MPLDDLLARSLTISEICLRDLSPQSRMAGTINPSSSAIATAILIDSFSCIPSSS